MIHVSIVTIDGQQIQLQLWDTSPPQNTSPEYLAKEGVKSGPNRRRGDIDGDWVLVVGIFLGRSWTRYFGGKRDRAVYSFASLNGQW
jgi:hypothetical protein